MATRDGSKKNGANSHGLSFLERPLTKAQLFERGNDASQLLQSPVFNLAFRSTIQQWQDQILETEEHETKKREGFYLKMQALGEAVGELSTFYHLAASLSADDLAQDEHNRALIDQQAQHGYTD